MLTRWRNATAEAAKTRQRRYDCLILGALVAAGPDGTGLFQICQTVGEPHGSVMVWLTLTRLVDSGRVLRDRLPRTRTDGPPRIRYRLAAPQPADQPESTKDGAL